MENKVKHKRWDRRLDKCIMRVTKWNLPLKLPFKRRFISSQNKKKKWRCINYEAQLLQKWSRTRTGYFLGICNFWILLHAYGVP